MHDEGDFSILNKLYLPLYYFSIQTNVYWVLSGAKHPTSAESNDKQNQSRVRDY